MSYHCTYCIGIEEDGARRGKCIVRQREKGKDFSYYWLHSGWWWWRSQSQAKMDDLARRGNHRNKYSINISRSKMELAAAVLLAGGLLRATTRASTILQCLVKTPAYCPSRNKRLSRLCLSQTSHLFILINYQSVWGYRERFIRSSFTLSQADSGHDFITSESSRPFRWANRQLVSFLLLLQLPNFRLVDQSVQRVVQCWRIRNRRWRWL